MGSRPSAMQAALPGSVATGRRRTWRTIYRWRSAPRRTITDHEGGAADDPMLVGPKQTVAKWKWARSGASCVSDSRIRPRTAGRDAHLLNING